MIEWLQKWYADHCDGDWEHEYGIVIETLDNPGWSIVIDLKNTELEHIQLPYSLNEISADDWVGYSIENNVFKAVGSSNNLKKLVEIFREIFESNINK